MRNGVDTTTLFATLDAVKQATPGSANSSSGPTTSGSAAPTTAAPSRTTSASARRRSHERTFVFDADHPAVLVGPGPRSHPVEFVLHALAACLTAGLANIAAARGVKLTEVRSTVTGDIDLQRHPRAQPGGAQRLRADHRSLHDQGRRPGREAARNRGAVPRPLGRLRRHHQRGARLHRGEHWLTVTSSATSPSPRGEDGTTIPLRSELAPHLEAAAFAALAGEQPSVRLYPQRSGMEA